MDEQRRRFDENIYRNWADYWECSPELFQAPGASFRERLRQGGMTAIHCSTIQQHTFIEHDPADGECLHEIVGALAPNSTVRAADVAARWDETACARLPVDTVTHGLIFHLYPPDLPERHLPGGFALRRLIAGDREQLRNLEEASRVEEVSDAYVSVDHEIACGVFRLGSQGETPHLVTAASAFDRSGFVDPGVLTHPDYRGRGFGSAAIHAICQWAIREKRLIQYRCNRDNRASQGVARRLGFTQYVIQDSIWLK